jgi:hypothetical protein
LLCRGCTHFRFSCVLFDYLAKLYVVVLIYYLVTVLLFWPDVHNLIRYLSKIILSKLFLYKVYLQAQLLNTMADSLYGTAIINDSSPKIFKFSGDPSQWDDYENYVSIMLNSRGLELPSLNPNVQWTETNKWLYATTAAESVAIMVPTFAQNAAGLRSGDPALEGKNLISYAKQAKADSTSRSWAVGSMWVTLEGTAMERARPGYTAKNFRLMFDTLRHFYKMKTNSMFLSHSVKTMESARKAASTQPLSRFDGHRALQSQFLTLAEIAVKPDDMSENDFALKKISAYEKRDCLDVFALLLISTSGPEKAMVENFIHRTIDASHADWDTLDPEELNLLWIQTCASHSVTYASQSKPEVTTDMKELKRLSTRLQS